MNETWGWRLVLGVCLLYFLWCKGWSVTGTRRCMGRWTRRWRHVSFFFLFFFEGGTALWAPRIPTHPPTHPSEGVARKTDTFSVKHRWLALEEKEKTHRKCINTEGDGGEANLERRSVDPFFVFLGAERNRCPLFSTHHKAPGAWRGCGPCRSTRPCVAHSRWSGCGRPCRTRACRCRRTGWGHKSSGRSPAPPRTRHWRDTPPYTRLEGGGKKKRKQETMVSKEFSQVSFFFWTSRLVSRLSPPTS